MENTQEHTVPERLLSLRETQEALGLSRAGLHNLLNRGELPTIRIGGRRLVAPADLRRFVDARREGGEP
jgi:predicted DNA-binding transcriptional regulator AlpA